MKRWKKNCRIGMVSLLLIPVFSTFIAYAAPTISIEQGNPPEKQKPPCTVVFSVSDPVGVVSIVVNGKELGPSGGDFYEADYKTFYNGTVTISAVNRNGETSKEVVQITNLATAVDQAEVPSQPQTQAPVPSTQAPTEAPTQTPIPPQTEAQAQAQTTQARVPETTQARVQETTKAMETEATYPVETSETEPLETEIAAEESSAIEESSQETPTESIKEETVAARVEEQSQAPELPPDSYKLYPGGRKNMIVPAVLISACICAIGYMIVTLIINKKRLKKYKALHDVLVKRQNMVTQKEHERLSENTIDGLPDDDYEEDEK